MWKRLLPTITWTATSDSKWFLWICPYLGCLLVVSANCGAPNRDLRKNAPSWSDSSVALEYPLRKVSYSQQNYFISTLATLNWRIKNIFEDWQEFKYPLMPRLM